MNFNEFCKLPFWKTHWKEPKIENILDRYITEEVEEDIKNLKDDCIYPTILYEFLDFFVGYKDHSLLKIDPEYYQNLNTNVENYEFKINAPLFDKKKDNKIVEFLNERKFCLETLVWNKDWLWKYIHPKA